MAKELREYIVSYTVAGLKDHQKMVIASSEEEARELFWDSIKGQKAWFFIRSVERLLN